MAVSFGTDASTRAVPYPIERDEVREYPFAAVLSAKVSRTIVGYFLGPCYRYTAHFHGWSGAGNTVAEAIAALVRAIEGPCAEWPETDGGENVGRQSISAGQVENDG